MVHIIPDTAATVGCAPLAKEILANAHRVGLDMRLDDLTPGAGACFYEAVVQQARRLEISRQLQHAVSDHRQLRKDVVDLVRRWHKEGVAFIMEFADIYELVLRQEHHNLSFDDYISAQYRTCEFAEHLFIEATTCLLGVPIWITSDQSTTSNPFTVIAPRLGGEDQGGQCDATPIILGLINNLHFQSLLPAEDNARGPIA